MACCDLHSRTCEPPSELCCYDCPEAVHRWGDPARGYHLVDGSPCVMGDFLQAAFEGLRRRRTEGGCTCKIGAWERVMRFDPHCLFHLADRCCRPILLDLQKRER